MILSALKNGWILILGLGSLMTVRAQTISIPYDVIRGPLIVMLDESTGKPLPLSPEFTRYNVTITDGFAQAKITQVFVNRYGKVKDMVYVFPLPHDGAVHAMRMQCKDSLFIAKIMEKAQAQKQYDSVMQSGGQGALLLQNRPNIFEQHIANLKSGDSATVEIEISMPLKYVDGTFEFSMPTLVAQRYGGGTGTASGNAANAWNPPADREGPSLQFNVIVQTGFAIADLKSPTHPLAISTAAEARSQLQARGLILGGDSLHQAQAQAVLLKSQSAYPNTDFVLRFRRASRSQDFSVASNWLSPQLGGYFALSLYPDTESAQTERGAIELVLLVDISGSQDGWPLRKEKEIAQALLKRLTPKDRLSVLAFNNTVTYAFPSSIAVDASSENILQAGKFVDALTSGGGTELLNAINTTLGLAQTTEHQRYYAFLTDGFITNEGAIFDAIRNHASKPTILTFGAGNNLNRSFLETSAAVGNGFATEITETESAAGKADTAWSRIESPQLTQITLDFGTTQVSEVLTPVQNRLYRGLPYTVYGRYAKGGTSMVTLQAFRNGSPIRLQHELFLADATQADWVCSKLWAREQIARLRLDEGVSQKNKTAIINLSVEHQVLSEYTAFLAIKPEAVTDDNNLNRNLPATGLGQGHALQLPLYSWAQDGTGWVLRLNPGNALLDFRVVNLQGKSVFAWSAKGQSPATQIFRWDGRDAMGNALKSGPYLVLIRTLQGSYRLPLNANLHF